MKPTATVEYRLRVSPWFVREGDLVLIDRRYRPFYARFTEDTARGPLPILMSDEANDYRVRYYKENELARVRRKAPVGICPHCECGLGTDGVEVAP